MPVGALPFSIGSMHFPHIRRGLAALAACAVLATACGGSSASVASEPTAEPTATPAPPAATAAPNPDPTATPATTPETTPTGASETTSILEAKGDGSITVGADEWPFVFVEPSLDGEDGPALIAYFNNEDAPGLVVVPIDLEQEAPSGGVIVVTPEGEELTAASPTFDQGPDDSIIATGSLERADGSTVDFGFELRFGVGNSSFELDGNRAIVRGDLGSHTYDQVQYLIDTHPEIDTLVLQDIGGSVNDEVNVQTGRLVRAAGYTTYVPADGEIYSGGVDLFAAGATRIAEPGAVIGVHSWCCGADGETADVIPQDDPAHQHQIDYFTLMLGPDLGPAFYFFTLQAAPFDGIDPMTPAELDFFNVVSAEGVVGDSMDITAEAQAAVTTPLSTPAEVGEALQAALGADRVGATVLTLDTPGRVVLIAEPTAEAAGRITDVALAGTAGAWTIGSATEWHIPTPGTSDEAAVSSLDFGVGELPETLAPLASVFTQHIDVWGIHVVATESTDETDIVHAANVLAQYLDNDADGAPDDDAVVASMVNNRATLLMAATPDEFEQLDEDTLNQVFDFVGQGGQDLYGSETNPANEFDASLEEVHHLILNTGWSLVYPDQLGINDGSELSAALDTARGGRFDTVPTSYPDDAWFTYDDRTCTYDCMLTEYFYWAHTSLLGAQQDRADEIGHEWRLATPEQVQAGDSAVVALIDALPLPTTVPDGNYIG